MDEMSTNEVLLTGPAATVRPTAVRDTWGFRLRLKGMPHEARCHLCDEEHGPDTRESCARWVENHLRQKHGVPVVGEYEVRSGEEQWQRSRRK